MDGHIRRSTLRCLAELEHAAIDVGNPAAAAIECLHVPMFTRKGNGCIEPGSDGREALKVAGLQGFCFPTCHFQLTTKGEVRDAIKHCVVDCLSCPAHVLGDICRLNSVDLAGGVDMDVLTGPKGCPQLFILSHVCKDSELNLGVVGA